MSGRVVINQFGSRNPTLVASQYNISSGVSQLWINVYRDESNDWVMLLNRKLSNLIFLQIFVPYYSNNGFDNWGGQIPLNKPKCGYTGMHHHHLSSIICL
jgi:hypothetical protein